MAVLTFGVFSELEDLACPVDVCKLVDHFVLALVPHFVEVAVRKQIWKSVESNLETKFQRKVSFTRKIGLLLTSVIPMRSSGSSLRNMTSSSEVFWSSLVVLSFIMVIAILKKMIGPSAKKQSSTLSDSCSGRYPMNRQRNQGIVRTDNERFCDLKWFESSEKPKIRRYKDC